MPQTITPFLMFEGDAQAALTFYTGLFPDAEVVSLTRRPDDTVLHAVFSLAGQRFMCIDSDVHHEFGFTPSISLFVQCESEQEVDRLFAALAEGGQELMPLGDYGFSARFGWVNDRFGVSWQLSLPLA
ncbi:VOC family protein [Kutzneria viridogrisea]|uniref:3-demethylubiquinone-9 3-methyltransferase (Glyoxalase superfamily) n=1 Tax=Kutzneria viridogrisea TaxID=47990 RepID=A0ABR6BYD4_9PSEU|nr:putative 3-demethylubiquinone-9 3-methyltransferase (glyoxalase superfamily) [Kutzneria viridogrisea]